MSHNSLAQVVSATGHVMVEENNQSVVQYDQKTTVFIWGGFPFLTLVVAIGLLIVAFADTAARATNVWAEPLFWSGLLIIYVPVMLRLCSVLATREERLALVIIVGLGLYFVKVLHSPLGFTYHDETAHWRTAIDIFRSGHLFAKNPLLLVSPLYPGLENATVALASTSNLTIFTSGIIILAAGRFVLLLALFLFYEEISQSARSAGIAAMLYMINPQFLFFDAQYAYESLALVFAILVLFVLIRRLRVRDRERIGFNLVILLGLASTIVTHHITSYALMAFLMLWAVIMFWVMRRSQGDMGNLFILALVITLTWTIYIATLTVGYLAPNLRAGATELFQLIRGESFGRELFHSSSGKTAPLMEQMFGFGAVGCLLIAIPFSLLHAWRQYRTNILALTLMIGTLAYPVSLALRLTHGGYEISARSAEFLFIAIAFVLTIGIIKLLQTGRNMLLAWLGITAYTIIVLVGGVVIGRADWMRLPGTYIVGADTRSIESQGVAAAEWARIMLGPGNRIATDRTNRMLMGTYGEQYPVTSYGEHIYTSQLFFAPTLSPVELTILRQGKLKYLVVDHRLSSALPQLGFYFEIGEPGTFERTAPIDPAALAKFDKLQNISRVFDSGDIVIYDVGELSGER